ncbi:unnamed protein product [Gongylonema pulchrum]|uniref:Calponin-homology (CH) domain-containing protein n=1 Tax=Gongylonema pulchrum TaxID=637853 RepID=A0A183DW04_9BILA|nr:unnamed protein product [Gongylonema pulchrum]
MINSSLFQVEIRNFSSSWADGMAFCALIHRFAPNSFDFRTLNPKDRRENFELAFRVAELRMVNSSLFQVEIRNFSSSWADGMAFCALIHRFAPNSFDFRTLNPKDRRENFELAFRVAEQNGVVRLLEVDDMLMMGDQPDWKCVFTYVQSFYSKFKDYP